MTIRKTPMIRRKTTDPIANLFPHEEELPFQETDSWTIVTALNIVLQLAEDSKLSEAFWLKCKAPLEFLTKVLGLTKMQIVVLAILIEEGEALSWKGIGKFLNCSRLSVMVYSEEIEQLIEKRWIIRRSVHEIGGEYEGFSLVHGVVTALRNNKVFVPEKIDGLTEQQFVDRLESRLNKTLQDHRIDFDDDEEWMQQLVKANPQLPLCQEALRHNDIHVLSLLMMITFDYAQWADSPSEGLHLQNIDNLYPEDYECDDIRRRLRDGSHVLMRHGLIEHKCEDGIADTDRYVLTREAKTRLLSGYVPSRSRCKKRSSDLRFLKSHTTIKEKALFFNTTEQQQIDRLASLLSTDNLPSVQRRLEEQGLRKGFACLFYGAPGTGKTETVLQIARQTGRDIMQVDIAGLRDKWVGESEKNIKEIFSRYRMLCRNSSVIPILFFNEADAVINKRTENIEHSVDKMDNAMQNIILQEIEDLEGILIATTNLTSNLDRAFERRFLYKVEFHKPDTDVKTKIWCSMLTDISQDDARQLASRFDFSGGQIENIARKRTIDYILSGRFATLPEIEAYCRCELLADKRARKPVTGFSC